MSDASVLSRPPSPSACHLSDLHFPGVCGVGCARQGGVGRKEGRKEIQGLGAEAFPPPLEECCESKQMVLIAVKD